MAPRPNILLLHCHDLGRFLGCYGVPTVCTLNLDALAAVDRPFYLQVGYTEPHRAGDPHRDPPGVMCLLGPRREPDDERGVRSRATWSTTSQGARR